MPQPYEAYWYPLSIASLWPDTFSINITINAKGTSLTDEKIFILRPRRHGEGGIRMRQGLGDIETSHALTGIIIFLVQLCGCLLSRSIAMACP